MKDINKKEKPYIIYNVMQRFFWLSALCSVLILPILPLISAYREWQHIVELQKDPKCNKVISEMKIKDMWWKHIKTHYRCWYERIKSYKMEREEFMSQNVA